MRGESTTANAQDAGSDKGSLNLRPGQPDIFGSIAITVARTPLDDKWRKASAALMGGPIVASLVHSVRNHDLADRLKTINQWVNAHLHFADDVGDSWASANETLDRRAGDCEDYAILKLKLLEAAGVNPSDIHLVIVYDRILRAEHAILSVRTRDGFLVLDSLTDQIVSSDSIRHYHPILSFNGSGRWVHGFRIGTGPPRLAGRTSN